MLLSRIFMSHSSHDNRAALALRQWLIEQDHELADEIFLDIHPEAGLPAGRRWKDALVEFTVRCEVVVCLVSSHWLASRECTTEYRTAENLGKKIFIARLEPVQDVVTREWQRSELHGPGQETVVRVDSDSVSFRTAGLHHLRDGLRAAGITAARFPWPPPHDPHRAPYRGWMPFQSVDAAIYFGREQQILRGLDRLRRMRDQSRSLFVVLGPSGAGKSSFLRAGLLPRLAREDREFIPLGILRPEHRAVSGEHGLAAALHAARAALGLGEPTLGHMKAALAEHDCSAALRWLAEIHATAKSRIPGEADPTVVLPIDQAEELFGVGAGTEASAALEILQRIVSAPVEDRVPFVVIAAIRTDRFEQMQSAEQLAGIGSELFDELKPLDPDRFRQIITEPARRARATGRPFDIEPELVDELISDCRSGADALPLLALTLSILYRDYASSAGAITVADYRQMGGIDTVVAAEVDHILDHDPALRESQLKMLRSAFVPWLATFAADVDEPLRRIARYDDLPAEARPLIDRFVDRRLLVKDRRGGDITVEVALESLLRQWTELAGWLREQSNTLRAAEVLERAAAEWERHDRASAWLLTGARLADAEDLADRPGYRERLRPVADLIRASRLSEDERASAELGLARDHAHALRRRARALAVLAAVGVVIAVFAAVGFVREARASERADTRAREAIAARLIEQARQMRSGLRTEGDVRAIHQILAAHAISPGSTEWELLNAQYELRHLTRAERLPFPPSAVAASDNGETVAAISDTSHHVTRNGLLDRSFTSSDRITHIAVSANGSAVVAVTSTGTLLVSRAGETVRSRPVGADVWDLRVSADGSTVVVVHNGHLLIVREGVEDVSKTIIGNFLDVALSADGSTVVAGDDDANLYVFRSGESPVFEPAGGGRRVAVSADGSTIAVGKISGEVAIMRPKEPPHTVHHTAAVSALILNADGSTVIATDDSGELRIARNGEPEQTRRLAGGAVRLATSADGTVVSAGDERGTLLIVRANTPDRILHLPDRVSLVRVAPNSSTVTAVSADGTVYTAQLPPLPRSLRPSRSRIDVPVISKDGATIVRRASRGTWLVIHKGGPEREVRLSDSWGIGPVISDDGSTVALGDGGSEVHILRDGHPDYVLPLPGPVPRTTEWRATDVGISADGTTIAATASYPPMLFIYRADGLHQQFALSAEATGLAMNADGSIVAVADENGGLSVARDGELHQWGTLEHRTDEATIIARGGTVVVADRWAVLVAREGATTRTIRPPRGGISGLALSADGSTVAVGSDDDVAVMPTAAGGVATTFPLPGYKPTLDISADGRTVAAGDDDGSLVIAHDGMVERRIRLTEPLRAQVFSEDGSFLVATGIEGTVWYWRRVDPAPVVIVAGGGIVWRTAVDEARDEFVLIESDTVDRVPILVPDAFELCAKLPAPITDEQWQDWITHDYPRQSDC
ncbi:nSTAND1 domain-containing NTPase [Nocardia takedensis]|uniref:nSTAND1 domain-containing NTPase n=1 Tax=Nocardia takedensis TaxID=259390 RepID=UPI0002E3794C|nr:TIR domain-containing protein [Nocardia takedensis]